MKFSGQSDRTVVISLPSAITGIFWHEKEGFVNGAVTFEVTTQFVYWGAPIKIQLKNKEGKTIKNFDDGKVFELHRRIIPLGPEAAGGVFCEVELPEHKLKVQSPLLKVPGAIRVKSVTWKDKESGKVLTEVTREQETQLEAKVEGGSQESKAFFTVFEKRGEHVHRLIDLPAKVEQGTMAVNWVFTHSAPTAATYSSQSAREPTAEKYQPPAFFIEATVAGAKLKGEGIPLQDATVVEVVDENGIPQSEREVTVILPDGSERKEVTDELGKVYLGNIPSGEIRFILGPPVAKKAAADGGEEAEGRKKEEKGGKGVAPKAGGGMGDVKMAEREREDKGKALIPLDALKVGGDNLMDAEKLLGFLNKYAKLYEVNTKWRIAHFLAQVGHESSFKATSENLSYSESRMKQIFGCKAGCWTSGDCPKDKRKREKLWDNPSNYAHNPANLANYVYADRLGNGDESSGDGYKYRGRGLIQLTGKSNYQKYNDMHNERAPHNKLDFLTDPDLIVQELEYAVESAFAWWNWNRINLKCVNGSDQEVKAVTLAVNGGIHGLDDRLARFKKIKDMLLA